MVYVYTQFIWITRPLPWTQLLRNIEERANPFD